MSESPVTLRISTSAKPVPEVVKLWAYECSKCGNHTLTISRPYRCGSCRKRYPKLVGSVDMTLRPLRHRPYPTTPDPFAFSDPKDLLR